MTDRQKRAAAYHENGFNCCQSVLAAFQDITGLSEEQALAISGGFGGGMGSGEVCGAVAGAVMAIGMAVPFTVIQPAVESYTYCVPSNPRAPSASRVILMGRTEKSG